MRPLPYRLATPRFGKMARRSGAAPDKQGFGDPAALLAPVVFRVFGK